VVKIVRKAPGNNKENDEESGKVMEALKETEFGQSGVKDGILWIMIEGKGAFKQILDRLGGGEWCVCALFLWLVT